MNSDPPSPTSSDGSSNHQSEVPTEPLPASEILRWNDHMTRRKHFLSDYERYNPVQNMHALANHVFDLSENVHRISDEVAVSRRMLGMVSDSSREANEQLRVIGEEVSLSRREMSVLKYEFDGIKGDVDSLKMDVGGLRADVEGLKIDVEGLRGMMEVNRREIGDLRRETQQGFAELKGMIAMLVSMRA